MRSRGSRNGQTLKASALAIAALALHACASPASTYMGIDLAGADAALPSDPRWARLHVARTILILDARDAGCYDPMQSQGKQALANQDDLARLCRKLFADITLANTTLGSRQQLVPTASQLRANLAQAARSGDKDAQLALGIRFEEGIGVARDLAKAKALYRLAASDSGGVEMVSSPGFFGGETRLYRDDATPKRAGLEEAKRRLEALGG